MPVKVCDDKVPLVRVPRTDSGMPCSLGSRLNRVP